MKHDKSKAEKEIDELLGLIKKKTGLNQEQIAEKIGYNRSYLSQAKKTDSNKLYTALSNEFRAVLENITTEEPVVLKEPPAQYGRSLLEESVRNLSEASKIHAENDRINAKNIERLIALLEKSNLSELSKSQQGSFGPEGQTAGNGFSPVSRQSEDSKKKADK